MMLWALIAAIVQLLVYVAVRYSLLKRIAPNSRRPDRDRHRPRGNLDVRRPPDAACMDVLYERTQGFPRSDFSAALVSRSLVIDMAQSKVLRRHRGQRDATGQADLPALFSRDGCPEWRRARQARTWRSFGLTNFGVNLTRLAPGGQSALRHAHGKQDEFVYILEGEAVLITDAGETVLKPGMCAGFKAGTGDAHHMINRTKKDVVFSRGRRPQRRGFGDLPG
jgi:mannose-6-phosphate isomerase-like protein (cupin superfamily)